jgi:phosphatidate cytidylyltransferase
LGSFKVRTISGTVLIIIMAVLLIVGGDLLFAALLAVSCIGMYELYRLTDIHERLPGILGYIAAVVYYFVIRTDRAGLSLAVFVALLITLMFVYVITYPSYRAEQIMTVPFGLLYVAVMLSFIYRIRVLEGGKYLVWLVIGCSWAADTCAYLVGVRFGRHKITPKLSPKKSLEGAIGGVVGAALIAMIFAFCVRGHLQIFGHPVIYVGLITACGAVVSMVGDLTASGIKRNYGIKDYGTLIPGHGGILDRFDSVIITAPIIYALVRLLSGSLAL